MKKQSIIIQGKSNSGKSTSIHTFFKLLNEKYPDYQLIYKHKASDVHCVIDIEGIRIGIRGQGDPAPNIKTRFSKMVKHNCDIIVGACRMSGRTKVVVQKLADFNYNITLIPTMIQTNYTENYTLLHAKNILTQVETWISDFQKK